MIDRLVESLAGDEREVDLYPFGRALVLEIVVRSMFGDSLDAHSLARLDLANRAMRETTRLHPAGVLSPREAARDVTVGGYRIPKGTLILWSAHLAGRQPARRRGADAGLRPMSDHLPVDVTAGHRVYTSRFLRFYDLVVLGWFSNTAWRCPAAALTSHYDAHVSANHLDVGVGTGYFLDHCTFPTPHPRLALMDISPACLAATSRRVSRFQPETHTPPTCSNPSHPSSGATSPASTQSG